MLTSACNKNIKLLLRSVLELTIAFMFLLLCAQASSPLYGISGADYGIFRTMGDYLLNGDGILFKDIFDHKGPYMFIVQAIGIFISRSKWGIFSLEVINLAICLELYYQIGAKLCRSNTKIYISIACILFFHLITLSRGDTVEEWSLPYTLLCLLLAIRFLKSGRQNQPRLYALIYGISFGIISLIRINDAVVIAGIAIGISIIYIQRKELRELVYNIVFFLAGIIVAISPALIYFIVNSALYDMIYANFLFNLVYFTIHSKDDPGHLIMNLIYLSPLILAIIATLLYDKKYDNNLSYIVIPSSILCLLIFYNTSTYPHYFTDILPIFYLMFLCMFAMSGKIKYAIASLPFLIWLYPPHSRWQIICAFHLRENPKYYTSTQIMSHFSQIPKSEYSSIYLYEPAWSEYDILYDQNSLPVGKYFFGQGNISKYDSIIEEDILNKFEEASPKWIISSKKINDTCLSEKMRLYELVDSIHHESMTNYYLYQQR